MRFVYLFVLPIVFGLYNILQSTNARLAVFEKEVYAGLAFGCLVLYVLVRLRTPLTSQKLVCGKYLIGINLFFIPTFLQEYTYPTWILADYLILMSAAVVYDLCNYFGTPLNKRTFKIVLICCAFAAVLAPLFRDYTHWGRFEPPDILLICTVIVLSVNERDVIKRSAFILCLACLFILSYLSQVRVYPIYFLFALLVVLLVKRGVGLIVGVAVLLFPFLIYLIVEVELEAIVSGSRFSGMSTRELFEQDFVTVRYAECKDVLLSFVSEFDFLRFFLGGGFGATFKLDEMLYVAPWVQLQEFRITEDGQTHLIHVQPVMMIFRFGVLGFILYGWWFIKICSSLRLGLTSENALFNIVSLAVMFYVIRSFLRPVVVNFDFPLTVGVFLYFVRRAKLDLHSYKGKSAVDGCGDFEGRDSGVH